MSNTTLTPHQRKRARYWFAAGRSDRYIATAISGTTEAVRRYRVFYSAGTGRGTSLTTTPLSRYVWRLSILPSLTPQQEQFMAIYIAESAAIVRRTFSDADHLVRTTGMDYPTAKKSREVQTTVIERRDIFGCHRSSGGRAE